LAALSSLPVPALPWPAGLRASPFLEPVLMPVVVLDFILLDFIGEISPCEISCGYRWR
jgi:hypothetical protein